MQSLYAPSLCATFFPNDFHRSRASTPVYSSFSNGSSTADKLWWRTRRRFNICPVRGLCVSGVSHSSGGRPFRTVEALRKVSYRESLSGDDRFTLPDGSAEDAKEPKVTSRTADIQVDCTVTYVVVDTLFCALRMTTLVDRTPGPSKYKGSPQAVGVLAAMLGIGTLAAIALTLSSGGPSALLSIVSKSGFPAAFALIFISEIGDKTFFIAALLAMRHSKWLVLLGASGALAAMTVISVIIGKLFQKVPAQLQTTLPVGEYAAVALLLWFGLRSIKAAWDMPSAHAGAQSDGEIGELAEAEEFLKQTDDKKVSTPLEVLGEAFTLIFVAEWGDRSMLATIALGAAQSPWGVASGAIAGHVLATLLAVLGGALLAGYLSEKLIGYFGGFLFLAFAAATLAGVF